MRGGEEGQELPFFLILELIQSGRLLPRISTTSPSGCMRCEAMQGPVKLLFLLFSLSLPSRLPGPTGGRGTARHGPDEVDSALRNRPRPSSPH